VRFHKQFFILLIGLFFLQACARREVEERTEVSLPSDWNEEEVPVNTTAVEADFKAAVEMLKEGDQNAIPSLKRLFQEATDKPQKQTIAQLLMIFEIQDQEYFEFLAAYARQAVDDPIPSPVQFDDAGRSVSGDEYGEEFLTWCAENRLKPEEAAMKALVYAADVTILGHTGDPRGYEILLRALDSPNYMIVAQAASGLGRIGDRRAIPLILEAALRTPAEIGLWFAEALLYFEDADGEAAARQLIKDETLLAEVRRLVALEKATLRQDKAMFLSTDEKGLREP